MKDEYKELMITEKRWVQAHLDLNIKDIEVRWTPSFRQNPLNILEKP